MRRVILLAVVLALLASGLNGQTPVPSRLLCGFDSRADLAGIRFSTGYTLVTDKALVSQGTGALKLTFKKGTGWPGFSLAGAQLKGWQNYDLLLVDVNNLSDARFPLTMRFDDARTHNYGTRAHFGKSLRPGRTTLKIPLKLLKRENGQPFDVTTLKRFIIFTGTRQRDVDVVFDNLRLANDQAETIDVPGAHLFDFGSPTSRTFPGFVKVTPKDGYAAAKGYGWVGPGKLSATNSALPDDLAGDYVQGLAPVFRIDVPDGQYRVLIWAFNPNGPYSVELAGKRILEPATPAPWSNPVLYRGISDDYYPGKDLWDSYIEIDYPCFKTTATAAGGKLEFVSRGARMAGIVVYPVKVQEQMKPVLADVLKRRREQFESDYCTVEIPKANAPAPTPTPAQTRAGYIVFFPRITDVVYPTTVATAETSGAKLTLAAARGQRQSATFALTPLRALECLTVSVSGLVARDGAKLDARNLRVRLVRYFERKTAQGVYVPKPTQLVNRDVKLYPGFTRQYWLTVDVPEDARAGNYAGSITLTIDGAVETIPVELTVYPFTLPKRSRTTFAFYYHSPFGKQHFAAAGSNLADALEPEIIDMKSHGLNTFQLPLPRITGLAADRVRLDYTELETYVRLMKKHDFGIKHRPQMLTINLANYLIRKGLREFSDRFNTVFANTVGDIDRWFVGRGVKVMFCLVDEPREQALHPWNRNLRDTVRYLKLCRGVPGVMTTITVMADENHGTDYLPMVPLMDVVQTHPHARSSRTIELARREGKPELHAFNAGTSRLSFGLAVWKLKALGRWQWHYQWPNTSYHPFRGDHWAVVYPSPEGPVSTVAYEQVAEGITDYRYVEMLEGLIEQADRKGLKTAAAKKLLSEIENEIPKWPDSGLYDGTDVGRGATGGINSKLDDWRERLAVEIIGLTEALKK